GLPNGYDANSISSAIPGLNNDMLVEFSEPNSGTVACLDAPSIVMSYSEVEFLLAEASLRGWAQRTAAEHYNKAITANMQSTRLFPVVELHGGSSVISQSAIDAYLASNPLNTAGSFEEQMEQIYTQ